MTNHTPRTLIELLTAEAGRTPEAPAIWAPDRAPLTYAALLEQVARVVRSLNGFGLRCADRIAIVLPNGPEMAVTFLAVAAGFASAPLHPTYQAEEYDFYLSDLHASALIIRAGMESPARDVARQRGIPILDLAPASDPAGLFTLMQEGKTIPTAPQATFAGAADTALVLHTSGTTARPKIVPLTQANICASARNIGRALALTAADRCLNIMPLFHIHGLMAAVLASLAAGGSIVCTEGFLAPRFFDWMDTFMPTWYTAVPTMHQAILARAPAHAAILSRVSLRLIRSSSAPLPPSVMSQLESIFKAPVIEAYGMTEAAHQIASNPLPPQPRKPGSVGLAAGPEVQIMDPTGHILPNAETGEIVLRGENITAGYENNPAANANAFTRGWFRTGDQGYLDNDQYLFITGRLKELINRGGQKISPREVDEVLLRHPAVAQAVTFAMPHPTLGEDVAAAVVLKPDCHLTDAELRDFAARSLAYYKLPHQIVFLDDLPKGPTGKLQRIGLAQRLGLGGATPQESPEKAAMVAPRTPLEALIARIWCEVLRLPAVGIFDNFIALGGDSMLAAQVVARLRDATHTDLSLVHFLETPTIAEMAVAITVKQARVLPNEKLAQILDELEQDSDAGDH